MSEPLNDFSLQHFLNFKSGGHGMVQIDEPFQFDGANFVVMQEDKRYGRDVSFAGEQISFRFINKRNKLGHQFDRLVEYYQRYGFESDVEYVLRSNGTDYVIGTLDFDTAETDLINFFDCKVIQQTQQAIIKRRKDIKIDLFSDKDLDDNDITPAQTSRILFKATPIAQESEWSDRQPFFAFTGNFNTQTGFHVLYQNALSVVNQSEIRNTLSYINNSLPTFGGDSAFLEKFYNFGYIDAVDDLNDVTITIKDLVLSYFISVGADLNDDITVGNELRVDIEWYLFPIGEDGNNALSQGSEVLPYSSQFLGTENINRFNLPNLGGDADRYDLKFDEHQFVIPFIPRGFRLSMCFFLGRSFTITEWIDGSININTKSTAIDTVTRGVRLVDGMRQVVESINPEFDFSAPRFELGGEWYDNFIFDGNLIRGLNNPFVTSLKEISEHIQEFNSDFQIDVDDITFLKYDDFYADVEIGNYPILPDETFNSNFNELYTINNFKYKYKTFNQDEDDDNTIDAVHTESELFLRNLQVENVKDIQLPFIRDVFMGETTRIKGIAAKPTTSLSQDDKTFIYDVVPLPVNSTGGFTDSLAHDVDSDGNLRLLNNASFNWGVLGFNLGSTFEILTTANAGSYTVINIEQTVLTLTPIGVSPVNIESAITQIQYPLVDVDYQIRTNEGFAQVENVLAPEDYANLAYTPKRNITNNWLTYISTANRYSGQNINVSYYKNGGDLLTRLNTETTAIVENAPLTDFSSAILDPIIITTKVRVDFTEFWELADRLKKIRGYVTVRDNKGRSRKIHPKKLDFMWADNFLEITGELRKESLILNITKTDDTYSLVRDGYITITTDVLDWDSENGYIEFLGENSLSLTERIRFDLVTVNDVSYDNVVDLLTALQAL